MSIFPADVVLKTAIDLMISDLRCNMWLIDDVFSNFCENPYLKKKYNTQIQNAKDWFLNNKIYVEMGYVEDPVELPRISIIIGPEQQDMEMSTMGDGSPIVKKLYPKCIDKPIPYILAPFIPVSYDSGSGIVQVPASSMPNFYKVAPGMLFVNIDTAKGFPIQQVIGNGIFMIAEGSPIGSGNFAVIPKYDFYEAKVEHIWNKVNYSIVCTAMGDTNVALWLHDIAKYGLLRYKQGLLEAVGLYESLFDSGPLLQNPNLTNAGEVCWERVIEIKGITQTTFIKAPHRLVESAALIDTSPGVPGGTNPAPAPTAESGWIGGLEIASNLTSFTLPEQQNSIWSPIENDNE